MSKPYDFVTEMQNKQNKKIDLIMVEVSKAYISTITVSSNLNVTIGSALKTAFVDAIADGVDLSDNGDGYGWVISFESGNNIGTKRIIIAYNQNTGVITFGPVLDYDAVGDKVRISRCLFLAVRNTPVDFYLPDGSTQSDIAITYLPFPAKIEPSGTTLTGEILKMTVVISNVDRIFGNSVQNAGGLQGNRVIYMNVFDGYLDQGKEYRLQDIMYVDSVTITSESVQFALESKFNIVDIKLPLGTYFRDFCRFLYQGIECSWTSEDEGLNTTDYALARAATCDHTLFGRNGCAAHNNNRRFGGFPAIPPQS